MQIYFKSMSQGTKQFFFQSIGKLGLEFYAHGRRWHKVCRQSTFCRIDYHLVEFFMDVFEPGVNLGLDCLCKICGGESRGVTALQLRFKFSQRESGSSS